MVAIAQEVLPYQEIPIAAGFRVHVVQSTEVILSMQGVLAELSTRCGQLGAMDDLAYFLSRPGVLKKKPYLIVISTNSRFPAENLSVDDLTGVVLLYEYQVAGRDSRIFATDDTTGRRTVVAPPHLRSTVAMLAQRALLDRGGHCILVSYQHDEPMMDPSVAGVLRGVKSDFRWGSREREIVGYLPLEETLDATLAKMGQRTRNHLRYYRRRAESQLGCFFESATNISCSEFLEFNRACAYAVSEDVASWRYDSIKRFETPLILGVKDKDGRWLSITGGRSHHGQMEVHWQMNRTDLPAFSLSTVMRAYLIEHAVSEGSRRIYFEGGTTHSMKNSFLREKSTDLIVMRRSLYAQAVRILAKRFLPPENMLGQVLADNDMEWHLSEPPQTAQRTRRRVERHSTRPV